MLQNVAYSQPVVTIVYPVVKVSTFSTREYHCSRKIITTDLFVIELIRLVADNPLVRLLRLHGGDAPGHAHRALEEEQRLHRVRVRLRGGGGGGGGRQREGGRQGGGGAGPGGA